MCWYYGCNHDLDVQHDVYVDAPPRKWTDLLLMVGVAVGFAWLFTVQNPRHMTIAFICFVIVNMVGWVYLKKRTIEHVNRALEEYQQKKDIGSVLRTEVYQDYMFGAWQWYRFAAGIGFLLILVLIAFTSLPILGSVSRDFGFTLILISMLAVLEVWIWHKRIVLKSEWQCVEWLHSRGCLKYQPNQTDRIE